METARIDKGLDQQRMSELSLPIPADPPLHQLMGASYPMAAPPFGSNTELVSIT